MAIPIIGQTRSEAAKKGLPEPAVDLPNPRSMPEATPILGLEKLLSLVARPELIARIFALGRLSKLDHPDAKAALRKAVADPEPSIAETAVRALSEDKDQAALDAIAARFASASGSLAGLCAASLARSDIARLLAGLSKRSRLDDRAFAMTTAELARSGSQEALAYLERSMNRAGTFSPERRGALYAAVLLSGDKALVDRVVGMAISDSKMDEPEGGAAPSRVALASVCGLTPAAGGRSEGQELLGALLDHPPEVDADPDSASSADFRAALAKNDLQAALACFQPILDLAIREDAPVEYTSVIKRRRGFLSCVLERRQAIADLAPADAAVFLHAALDAARLLLIGSRPVSSSPALITIAKLFGSDPATISTRSGFAAALSKQEDHKIRHAASALANESLFDAGLMEKIAAVFLESGKGQLIFEASAAGRSQGLAEALLRVFEKDPARAEPILLEALEARPLVPATAKAAMVATGRIATLRLSTAIGRRFFELRQLSRLALADTVFALGDPRLLELIESRAYADEPEELAFVVLGLVADRPLEGKLASALGRLGKEPKTSGVRVPLRCKSCEETLTYFFYKIYVDPKAKTKDGDPAFAGDPTCKACGAVDQLATTEQAVQVMTNAMMELLISAEQGDPVPPIVAPRTTQILGRETGFAEALRTLDQQIEQSADSIRLHLKRARLRLLLLRSNTKEDLDRLTALDKTSVEAELLRAGLLAQQSDLGGAMKTLVALKGRLDQGEDPRLYEHDDRQSFVFACEDSIIELEDLGAEIPSDLDVREARDRFAARMERQAQLIEESRARSEAASNARERAR